MFNRKKKLAELDAAFEHRRQVNNGLLARVWEAIENTRDTEEPDGEGLEDLQDPAPKTDTGEDD